MMLAILIIAILIMIAIIMIIIIIIINGLFAYYRIKNELQYAYIEIY